MAATNLINLGMNPELAPLLQGNTTPLTATGTTQGAAKLIGLKATGIQAVTAGGNDAFLLPDALLFVPYFIFNPSATTAQVFPPLGLGINAVAVNNPVTIITNLARIFYRVSATRWVSFLAA